LIGYWSVPDVDRERPELALPTIERLVMERLIEPFALESAS